MMTESSQYDDAMYDDGDDAGTVSPRIGQSAGYGSPGNRPDASSSGKRPGASSFRRQGIAGVAQSKLLDLAESGKLALVESIDGLAAMSREMAEKVESRGNGLFGGYAWQAANLVGELQDTLRDKPVDELLDDGRDLIRRQPAVAVGIAMVAGFLAARLVKSAEL
ncbi:hypothetical protein GCM10011529_11110 [Polymorphobacter glacialis]|uniref:DUF883 family protein n=1 Tax=Sandarakinorhabdus glacialis TaxID=1614636 RepID=A0A917E6W3_9SPHN|nr:hypothetical protein [Polymorphobacter glacialis]GGE06502.1 hypothetical protein GCM10011529_11110 [Polymorphobacter glacialis]